jgi:hypothetical protein
MKDEVGGLREEGKQFPFNIKNEVGGVLASFFYVKTKLKLHFSVI